VLIAAALLLSLPTQNARAQSETPKLEVGAQYTLLRLRSLQPLNNPALELVVPEFVVSDSGFGGRVTYNLNGNFGVEGEVNFFPKERTNFAAPFYLNSRRTQGLFGVKAGVRSEKVGVFAKLRPGFMHFGEGTFDPRIQTILPVPPTASSTEFSLDAGGVLELYPSRRIALRFDLGDTIIRDGSFGSFGGGPSETTHNLQFTTGVGFRF
ncbi:MAG: outer membrane beta-barrel protein, partial [Blastocatellia bacterium]